MKTTQEKIDDALADARQFHDRAMGAQSLAEADRWASRRDECLTYAERAMERQEAEERLDAMIHDANVSQALRSR